MRKILFGCALAICALGAPAPAMLGIGSALAQSQSGSTDEGPKQIALTKAQIDQYIAAQKDLEAIFADAPENGQGKPDPKTMARLDAAAKKNHFAGYDELNSVAENIGLVLDGVDPKTKKYVGADVVLKQTIADVEADAKMTPAEKKETLAELRGELQAVAPLQFPANIALVVGHYDELAGEEQQKP